MQIILNCIFFFFFERLLNYNHSFVCIFKKSTCGYPKQTKAYLLDTLLCYLSRLHWIYNSFRGISHLYKIIDKRLLVFISLGITHPSILHSEREIIRIGYKYRANVSDQCSHILSILQYQSKMKFKVFYSFVFLLVFIDIVYSRPRVSLSKIKLNKF